MDRNLLFVLIALFATMTASLGYHFFNESKDPSHFELGLEKSGATIGQK